MAVTRASEWTESEEEWIVEGLICDSLTLISGLPKTGKSALALHVIRSLITGEPILQKEVKKTFNRIGWMGFDFKWQREVSERAPDLLDNIFYIDPVHYQNNEGWNQVIQEMAKLQLDFLVIDHLYGLGSGAELDRQHAAHTVLAPIQQIVQQLEIPILLITQAAKMSNGRAAHSVAFEGLARWMLRISGQGKLTRKIEAIGNNSATEELKVRLNPKELEILGSSKTDRKPRKREINLPERARSILLNATLEDLSDATRLGKWVAKQGWGINTVGSGRQFVINLIDAGLLSRESSNSPITRGPNLAA